MTEVAILCAAKRTAYRSIPGCVVFDAEADARTFKGGIPVVAHPPCRCWSAFTAHQAKPEPGERELGLWCVEKVRECGGVLEQPAHSRLWEEAGLPEPGRPVDAGSWAIEVCQCWWGYPMLKRTWLWLRGIPPGEVTINLRLHPIGADRRREQLMSHAERSETTPEFAAWLVDLARKAAV